MKRDFADFWNLLWELALGVCAAFAMLNLFAPQQDLPWKPLDLNRPIGSATAAKVADFVLPATAAPEETAAVTEACMQVLREAGVQVERAEDRDDGGFCVVRGAIRITGGAVTPLPGNPVLQCPLAVRYVIWERQVLQPAALPTFGSKGGAAERRGHLQLPADLRPDRPERPAQRACAGQCAGYRRGDAGGRAARLGADGLARRRAARA
jgi:hypothetical protein